MEERNRTVSTFDGYWYRCECGEPYSSATAADECALLDSVEAKQLRSKAKKRKPWDNGIIRGYN